MLDGVYEKMTWPGWKSCGGGLGLLASLPQAGLLEERREPPGRAYLKLGGTDD